MTTKYTKNFGLAKPDFRSAPWHDLLNTDLDKIDQIIYGALSDSGTPLWLNATNYEIGNQVVDGISASTWLCTEEHISAASGTFEADRIAHPTYWVQLLAGFAPRGEWTNSTAYYPYDLAYESMSGIFAQCKTQHVSNASGSIKDDAAHWYWIVDFSDADLSDAVAVSYTPPPGLTATNVQDALDQIDTINDTQTTQIVALNSVNVSQGTRLDNIETLNTTQNSRLSSVESTNAAQTAAIDSLTSRVSALEASPATVFPSNTKMLFGNASVPDGWIRDTSAHDKALRVVGTGNGGATGGSFGFSSIFNKTEVGSHALTVAQMPNHNHPGSSTGSAYKPGTTTTGFTPLEGSLMDVGGVGVSIAAQGGNEGHTHALELRLAYYDVIIGHKL